VPERTGGVVRQHRRGDVGDALCARDLPAEHGPIQLHFCPDRILRQHGRGDGRDAVSGGHDHHNDRFDKQRRLSGAFVADYP
jgi:hypothetical protein